VQVGVELRIYFFGTAVDVTAAPNASTRTYFGVADRRAHGRSLAQPAGSVEEAALPTKK
jgi:hypothetical protein